MEIETSDYTRIFSMSGIPVIFFTISSGFFISKYGRRVMTIIVLAMVLLGQCLSSIGVTFNTYGLLMAGQILINTGLDSWLATASTYVAVWFKNKEISLAMALDSGFEYLSVVMVFAVAPSLYNEYGSLMTPYWCLFIMISFSFICGLLLICMDRHSADTSCEEDSNEAGFFETIRNLPFIYWIVLIGQVTIYLAHGLQEIIISGMFQEVYGLDNHEAGLLAGLHFLIRSAMYPVAGYIIYKIGRKPLISKRIIMLSLKHSIVIIAATLSLVSTCSYLLLPVSSIENESSEREKLYFCCVPYLGKNDSLVRGTNGKSLVNAFGYVFYSAAIWPLIPDVVEDKYVPVAYGATMSAFDAGYSIAPIFMGYINDWTHEDRKGYFWSEVFIVGFFALGILDLIVLLANDQKNGGKLSIPDAQKKKQAAVH